MSLVAMVLADRIERFTPYYDRWMHLITFGRDVLVREAVLRFVQPGERLLDVGCGTGSLAVAAAQSGAHAVGIDRSRHMLALAREKAARARVAVDFRQGEVAFLPFRDETFDVATATFVLSELSRDEAALAVQEMAKAVRPGGRVIVADEGVPRQPLLWILSTMQRWLFALIAFSLLQELAPTHRYSWRVLLEEAGLSVREESHYEDGALSLIVAERPAELRFLRRDIVPLDGVLPGGIARITLHLAAWLAFPIAIPPGVYQIGSPTPDSPVMLTGNFLATVEMLQRALVGESCYVIVEDTSGWNVWCASDAGLFTAEKAAALIDLYGLDHLVTQHRLVIPRLGGRVRERLADLSQWDVVIGPVEARDIPEFLQRDHVTPAMRDLDRMYGVRERLRVGALTMIQLPVWLFPLRWLPPSLRRPVWRFALLATWLLPIGHYWIVGRTGIVKGGVLGLAASVMMLLNSPRHWTRAVAVFLSGPLIGWIYQSTSPVIYWKRLLK